MPPTAGMLGEMLLPTVTTPSSSASGTSPRRSTRHQPVLTTVGLWPGASSASTGSSGATPISGTPNWSTTTTTSISPSQPEDGYHLSADLADKAIEFIQDAHVNAPDKPFYLHYCPGAGHAPHHVSKEWADKFKGKFDAGWDEYRKVVHQRQLDMGIVPAGTELSAHDPDVPEWAALSPEEQQLYARMMEVFAGFLAFTDHHFGRVVDFLEEIGELDNTLII